MFFLISTCQYECIFLVGSRFREKKITTYSAGTDFDFSSVGKAGRLPKPVGLIVFRGFSNGTENSDSVILSLKVPGSVFFSF